MKKIYISLVVLLISFLSINFAIGSQECDDSRKPVCGEKQKVLITYPNKCELNKANVRFMYNGKCAIEGKIKEKPIKLTESFRLKIEKLSNKFILKLRKTSLTNVQKLGKLDKILFKIKILKRKKPRLSNILDYLYNRIANEQFKIRAEIQNNLKTSFEKKCVDLGGKWSNGKGITGKGCDFGYSVENEEKIKNSCEIHGGVFTTCGSGCGFSGGSICPSICTVLCKFEKDFDGKAGENPLYYSALKNKCEWMESPDCCLNSVETMKKGKFALAPKKGCPGGYKRNIFRCSSSYAWCEK